MQLSYTPVGKQATRSVSQGEKQLTFQSLIFDLEEAGGTNPEMGTSPALPPCSEPPVPFPLADP